jgi:translation initiation factor 2 subunit 3
MEDITKLETINVGIVGHIDHGKTTLLYKLSGKWTDTHSEELKRGITIKLGYSDVILKDEEGKITAKQDSKGKPVRYVTFVDAPGHEMLMATMLSGAAIMDAAILVVAANEGIKPQTREHLTALKAKGITKVIIVQNKIDLVSKEQAIKNYKDIKEFVKGTVAENSPIIPISAQQEINIDKILEELVKIKIERKETAETIFLVARSFDINKPGTEISNLHGGVLGGALRGGKLKIGDTIEIKPGYSIKKQNKIHYQTIQTKVVSLQKGNNKISEAFPGGSLAIETELDPSLTKSDSLSGCICSLPGKLPEITENIKLKFKLFESFFTNEQEEKVTELRASEPLMLSINTSTTVGIISKVKNGEAEISLKIPVVPLKGDSVGIARNIKNHWRLIGFGEII